MMMVSNILKEALAAGVTLYVEDGRLKFTAPKGGFPDELRAKIVQHKAEIVALLSRVEAAPTNDASSSPLQRVENRDALPLSFAQQRLWFVDQLEGGSHQYNISSALRLTGRLDRAALQRAFDEIVRRHEVLRTVYRSDETGQGLQVPRAPRPVTIDHLILDDDAQVPGLARAEAQRPFDLTADQLLRLRLLQLREEEYVLLFTMHHIASDGVSFGILVREFTALYVAYTQGLESPLPPLEIQYADFASWQRNAVQGEELERQVGYWKEKLAGLPRLHSLPLDKPRPARQQFAGHRHHHSLGREQLDALRRLAQSRAVTLFVLLQSAFSLAGCTRTSIR